MNTWHLLWIIPTSMSVGAFLMAIIAGGDCDPPWYDDEQYQ